MSAGCGQGKGKMDGIRNAIASLLVCATLTAGPVARAHESSGSAFGEQVNLAISPLVGATVNVSSGPLPAVSGSTPPAFIDLDSAASVAVNATVTNAGLPFAVGVLNTGLLTVSTQGTDGPSAQSGAMVNNLDLDLLAAATVTTLLAMNATTVSTLASVTGSCGAGGLTASGSTTLEDATVAGTLADQASVTGSVLASPPPNYVLLYVNLGAAGRLRVTLNEQMVGGNGISGAQITVNAIHVEAVGPLLSSILGFSGNVIIASSTAQASCAEADLSVTVTDAPDPVELGQVLTYTLNVSNDGPDDAGDVEVTGTLPPEVTLLSIAPDQGTCAQVSDTVQCSFGTLASGATRQIRIRVAPQQAGPIQKTASVSGDVFDPNPDNNQDTEASLVTEPVPGPQSDDPVLDPQADPVESIPMLGLPALLLLMSLLTLAARARMRD